MNSIELSHSQIKRIHCEVTGKETTLDNTVVLVKINGVIALKNLNYPFLDFENKIIKPIDKPAIRFYSELFVPDDLKQTFGRLFSIVNNEDDIEQSTAIMSKEGQNIFSGKRLFAFIMHIPNGVEILNLSYSMFFAVIDNNIIAKTKKCECWGNNYMGLGVKYRYKKILDLRKESQQFGQRGILLSGFDIAVSDCSNNNPNGIGYMYKTDGEFKSIDLCCNESAVSFCKKNNSIVYYNDFLNDGNLRVLTPETENINRNLQNPYLYRSLNI